MRLPDKVKLSEQISEDFRKLAHAGETVVSNDTSKNPITKGEANAAINAAAFITVPFLKGGEWT
jgi:F420-0:gamma-glutamyl ligase